MPDLNAVTSLLQSAGASGDGKSESPSKIKKISEAIDVVGTPSPSVGRPPNDLTQVGFKYILVLKHVFLTDR